MLEKIKKLLRSKVGSKRYNHSLCVAKEAKSLANHYKRDASKAELAGLLHDITKEFTEEEHMELFKRHNVNLNKIELKTKKLWHAISAPLYIKDELNILDKDILNAIRYHTTGRENMGYLEKIIFLADFISEDRFLEFSGVKLARDIAYKNLDEGVLHELSYSITVLISKESPVSLESVKAYNYYLINLREDSGK